MTKEEISKWAINEMVNCVLHASKYPPKPEPAKSQTMWQRFLVWAFIQTPPDNTPAPGSTRERFESGVRSAFQKDKFFDVVCRAKGAPILTEAECENLRVEAMRQSIMRLGRDE